MTNNPLPLSFNPSYFDEETRENYLIMGLMKRAWAAQLEVLSIINMICKKHNIEWYAHFGTLLGAIRHNGYIPWDDDIDIVMKRNDYKKFIAIAAKESNDIIVESVLTGNTTRIPHCFFTRVVNSDSICFDDDFLYHYHHFPYSAGIDIFPLDGVPEQSDERDLLYALIRLTLETELYMDNWDHTTKNDCLSQLEEYCGITFNKEKDIHQQLLLLTDTLSQSYSIEECSNIAPVGWYAGNGIQCTHSKSFYTNPISVPFENIYVNIPDRCHEILSGLYGENYMIPAFNTQSHDYPFWKSQKISSHNIAGHTGWQKREQYVASQFGIHEDEVLEIQLHKTEKEYNTYLYFCQKELISVNIPVDIDTYIS